MFARVNIISTTDRIGDFTVSIIVVSFGVTSTSTGSTSGASVGGEFMSESSSARVGVQTLPYSTGSR